MFFLVFLINKLLAQTVWIFCLSLLCRLGRWVVYLQLPKATSYFLWKSEPALACFWKRELLKDWHKFRGEFFLVEKPDRTWIWCVLSPRGRFTEPQRLPCCCCRSEILKCNQFLTAIFFMIHKLNSLFISWTSTLTNKQHLVKLRC